MQDEREGLGFFYQLGPTENHKFCFAHSSATMVYLKNDFPSENTQEFVAGGLCYDGY
jgi:hypothetical protein